jgi:CRP/FNR family transcriptional regulator, cyclic AMP receptor protein
MEVNASVYYRVWGVDNIAYGPVELPTLVSWIKQGRVLANSWIFRDDPGLWARAADVPELQSIIKSKPDANRSPASDAQGIKPGSLRRIKIFADMDDLLLESLLRYIEVIKVPVFATVVHKGEHGDAMFLVLEGELRARVLIEGRETMLTTMGVGDCFGELALLDHGPRSADVVANADSIVLKISSESLHRLFKEAPALAAPFLLALNRVIAQRVRALTKRYEDSIQLARKAQ